MDYYYKRYDRVERADWTLCRVALTVTRTVTRILITNVYSVNALCSCGQVASHSSKTQLLLVMDIVIFIIIYPSLAEPSS